MGPRSKWGIFLACVLLALCLICMIRSFDLKIGVLVPREESKSGETRKDLENGILPKVQSKSGESRKDLEIGVPLPREQPPKSSESQTPIRYVPPSSAGVTTPGKPLSVTPPLMRSLGIPLETFSVLNRETVSDFVFVTAASANHYKESMDAIGGVQTVMPGYKVYYYDLGLQKDSVKQLHTFCDVVYRKFDFSKYPKHVAKLTTYSFKGLIIHEALREHGSLVWMDASFRLKNDTSFVYGNLIRSGGFLQLQGGERSNFAVTNPRMFDYITTDVEKQKTTTHAQANCLFIRNTEEVYWAIIYWWALCSLDQNCIAPENSKLGCVLPKDPKVFRATYHECHRFDQSLMGLLASNLHGYNSSRYIDDKPYIVEILRTPTSMYKLKTCGP